MRRAAFASLVLLAGLGAQAPARAAQPPVAWRLGRSDVAVYQRRQVSGQPGAEKHGAAKVFTVYGHDLRDAEQYSPAAPVRGDLYELLAMRLPPADDARRHGKWNWHPLQTANIRIKGTVRAVRTEGARVDLEGKWTFKCRGHPAREERWWYDHGTATTRIVFDTTRGVIESSRLVIAFDREDMDKSGKAGFSHTGTTFDYTLEAVERMRPKDFQARVDTAIEKGLAHLRTLQKDDGTWKPHGNFVLGTTGLAVLTLVACGVPRDDPAVRKGLDYIFAQEATRTYEQSICLMAVDRAYTPREELDKLAAGRPVEEHVRDLPPARMAWVRRTAKALESGASSPGSWGYPPVGNTLLRFDSSNTQYAALGLRAATHMGYEVGENTWLGFVRHCKLVRERKGPKGAISLVRQGQAIPDESKADQIDPVAVDQVTGFRYSTLESNSHVDSAMACAAITVLLVARHQLQAMGSRRFNGRLRKEIEELLNAAWAWLDLNWRMDRHPRHPNGSWYWYFLYSLERACVFDQVKRVGGKDWYYEGAMQLLHRQAKKGAWNNPGGNATPPTCFALLFLKRGTSPLGAPITGR